MPPAIDADPLVHFVTLINRKCIGPRPERLCLAKGATAFRLEDLSGWLGMYSPGLILLRTWLAGTGKWWDKTIEPRWICAFGPDGSRWLPRGNRWSKAGVQYGAGPRMWDRYGNRKKRSMVEKEFREFLMEEQ